MDQESAMMIYLSYQKLRMPTFSKSNGWKSIENIRRFFVFKGVRQRRTENPLRERLLVRKFLLQIENYFHQQQQISTNISTNDQMEVDEVKYFHVIKKNIFFFFLLQEIINEE